MARGWTGRDRRFARTRRRCARFAAATLVVAGAGLTSGAAAQAAPIEDTAPPETTIETGPGDVTEAERPEFTFSSSEAPASFECRFDGEPFAPCSGPGASHRPASDLSQGPHSFEVVAIDAALNRDPTPAFRNFTVETPLGFAIERSRVAPGVAYTYGERKPTLIYRFEASRPTDLTISLEQKKTGRTVRSWRLDQAVPSERHELQWSGRDEGQPAGTGRYAFRIGPAGEPPMAADRFQLRDHSFPVKGRHRKRGRLGVFGAPRPGRIHTGFDVMAKCGTPIVSARAGRVKEAGYDSILGHYAVVGGRGENRSYVYLHMVRRPKVETGDKVKTGQKLGRVGKTGNARTTPCHLHFAIFVGRYRPGGGGHPIDPEPELDRWDRWS